MSELKTGTLLQGDKYRIEKVLGQGGFGITYLAEQTNLGRKVCIKEFFMKEYGERTAAPVTNGDATVMADDATILTGNAVSGGAKVASAADGEATVLTGVSAVTSAAAEAMGRYREKFVKEARTIARLDYPGIVRIHDVFEENGTAYYVMDFIEGENLNNLVKREGALSEERALGYIRQVAEALSYVHDHRIMHLDVKPANIIIRKSDDKAILIDFGTAKQYDASGTQTSTTPVGLSVGYAPIELTKPGGVQTFSPETDVYSLGATLYYLVTGQNPPDASERMEMLIEGEKFQFPDTVSSTVASAIEQALQSRKKRPQTVTAFMELLPTLHNVVPEKKLPEFCPSCREKLTPSAKFCPNCGTTILAKESSQGKRMPANDTALKRQEKTPEEQEKAKMERAQAAREREAQRIASAEKRRLDAERKRKEQERKKTNDSLIGYNVFFFIGGLVMFILLNTNGGPEFGYIGFGAFIVSFVLSIVCVSRKAARGFSWISLFISLLHPKKSSSQRSCEI